MAYISIHYNEGKRKAKCAICNTTLEVGRARFTAHSSRCSISMCGNLWECRAKVLQGGDNGDSASKQTD